MPHLSRLSIFCLTKWSIPQRQVDARRNGAQVLLQPQCVRAGASAKGVSVVCGVGGATPVDVRGEINLSRGKQQ